jgi:hypothetical protein
MESLGFFFFNQIVNAVKKNFDFNVILAFHPNSLFVISKYGRQQSLARTSESELQCNIRIKLLISALYSLKSFYFYGEYMVQIYQRSLILIN